jgi:hypothetical protein
VNLNHILQEFYCDGFWIKRFKIDDGVISFNTVFLACPYDEKEDRIYGKFNIIVSLKELVEQKVIFFTDKNDINLSEFLSKNIVKKVEIREDKIIIESLKKENLVMEEDMTTKECGEKLVNLTERLKKCGDELLHKIAESKTIMKVAITELGKLNNDLDTIISSIKGKPNE